MTSGAPPLSRDINSWPSPSQTSTLSPPTGSPSLPSHWVPLSEAPLKSFSRAPEEKHIHESAPSSRCEQWSTLRQMLPSKGHCVRHQPPKWGTGLSTEPKWSVKKQKRFPHINSPMTKYGIVDHLFSRWLYSTLSYLLSPLHSYVDDMHLTNRLFKLH